MFPHGLRFVLPALALGFTGCDAGTKIPATRSFDLRPDEWAVGFADLPVDHAPELYELDYGSRRLPSGLEGDGLYVQGHNRSDDLSCSSRRSSMVCSLEPAIALRSWSTWPRASRRAWSASEDRRARACTSRPRLEYRGALLRDAGREIELRLQAGALERRHVGAFTARLLALCRSAEGRGACRNREHHHVAGL